MGNPINPVVWLANKLAEFDDYIRARRDYYLRFDGNPVRLKPGDFVKVTYSRLGSVGARFVN